MSILGVSKAVSTYFESKELFPWNERLYPFRIRLDKVFELNIPLKAFKGRISGINSSSNPIPMGVSIVPLSIDDAKLIISLNNE
jgi:hypothetical protein